MLNWRTNQKMENTKSEIPPSELRVLGLKETMREAKLGNIERIILAKDCDIDFTRKVYNLNLPLERVSSRAVLGQKLGIDVPCGVVGVLKAEKL